MSSASSGDDKIRIAIIGGGCAAMTAAFELTRPEQKKRYAVTVYQMGWRLGGKGASGRNSEVNKANRTEEHGLHVWMGFYENAFRLMRECYAELRGHYPMSDQPSGRPASRFVDWDEAFFPDYWVGVADESPGAWRVWSSFFPATPGLPGDALDPDNNPFTLRNYMARACDLLRALIHSAFDGGPAPSDADGLPTLDDPASASPAAIIEKLTSVLRTGVLSGVAALYEAMGVLKVVLDDAMPLPNDDYIVMQYAKAIASSVKKQAECVLATNVDLRAKLDLIDLVVTVVVGILRDGLLSDPDGLDAIDDEDCKVWLRRHGASARAVESPLVRALYDMAFANQPCSDGDVPGLAAGQALRGALRMFFTYRGSLFWKMRAGMGDAVFSPLYEVLKNRGVAFQFFHELTDILVTDEQSDGSKRVTELHFRKQTVVDSDRQALRRQEPQIHALERKALSDGEYYPLDADGCWPSRPHKDQIIAGNDNTPFESPSSADQRDKPFVLQAERDFDCVVLGIGLGAIPTACPTLVKTDGYWTGMVENVKTVGTQALQLWLREGLEALTPTGNPTTVSGFLGPFDTWSDMTHIIAEESWAAADLPKGLLYLCGALPYTEENNQGFERTIDYLDHTLPLVLPKLRDPRTREFRWDLLAGAPTATGQIGQNLSHLQKRAVLSSQYLSLNTNPSDRYVLTRPGSSRYRISPLDPTYRNLTIAGDWTDCGFNEGCVEAAVMSGLLAAHAISLSPPLDNIIGYDHP